MGVAEVLLADLSGAHQQRDALGGVVRRRDEAIEHAGERLPLLRRLVEARELLEHERLVRRLVGGALERGDRLVAVAEPLRVEAPDPVERHRAHAAIGGLLRLALQHRDQIAPAALRVMQALERLERARDLRIEAQRGLVELDGRVGHLAARLEHAGALHDERGPVPGIARDRVRDLLVGLGELGPAPRVRVALLERLEDGGIAAIELARDRVLAPRLALLPEHVLEEPAFRVQQRGLGVRVARDARLGVEERQRHLVVLARDHHAARAADRRDVLGRAVERLLVVGTRASQVLEVDLGDPCDLVVQPRLAQRLAGHDQLALPRIHGASRVALSGRGDRSGAASGRARARRRRGERRGRRLLGGAHVAADGAYLPRRRDRRGAARHLSRRRRGRARRCLGDPDRGPQGPRSASPRSGDDARYRRLHGLPGRRRNGGAPREARTGRGRGGARRAGLRDRRGAVVPSRLRERPAGRQRGGEVGVEIGEEGLDGGRDAGPQARLLDLLGRLDEGRRPGRFDDLVEADLLGGIAAFRGGHARRGRRLAAVVCGHGLFPRRTRR